MKKGSKLRRLLAAVGCYLAVMAVFYWIVADDWSLASFATEPVNQDLLLPEIKNGEEIIQSFTVRGDQLQTVSLRGEVYPAEGGGETVHFSIGDGERILWEKEVSLSDLSGSVEMRLDLEDFPQGLKGKRLDLRIRGTGGISFWAGTTRSAGKVSVNNVTEEKLTLGNQAISGELVMIQHGRESLPYSRYFWPAALGLGVVGLAVAGAMQILDHRGKTGMLSRAGQLIRQYEFLLKTLVVRDFKVRYKAFALGMIWSFLNPLLMTFVYLFVFSTLFRSNIPNFPVYLLSGIVIFNYFAEATNLGMESIVGNAGLITKVYIPKYIFPISKAISSAINLVISLIPLFIMMALTGTPFHKSLLLLPLLILYLVLFCVGIGLILSTVMVFFRDVHFLWGIVLTILNFVSPIFYPESIIPARFIQLYHLNPMYQYLYFMRTIVTGGISPSPVTFLYCTLASGTALVIGLFVFRKMQSSFVLHL